MATNERGSDPLYQGPKEGDSNFRADLEGGTTPDQGQVDKYNALRAQVQGSGWAERAGSTAADTPANKTPWFGGNQHDGLRGFLNRVRDGKSPRKR